MLEIFRDRQGFHSYELIAASAGLFSVSHWESSSQADAATDAAAAWVADHIAELVKLQQSDIGEVVMSSLAPANNALRPEVLTHTPLGSTPARCGALTTARSAPTRARSPGCCFPES